MGKAVFITKVSPTYKDMPEVRYHFPRTYLAQAEQAVGDWIVYYEPRRSTGEESSRGGRQAYFATARVDRITPDPELADHFYAEVSEYLSFARPVPFRENGQYYEAALRKEDGSTNRGAFGRAVRVLPDSEYDLIWRSAFDDVLGLEPRVHPESDVEEEPMLVGADASTLPTFDDEPMEVERRIVEQLVSRPFRDRAFSVAVKSAYADTCAATGIKIVIDGGRSEVQAAHIRPVTDNGSDSVRNGIALSGTAHWMFDKGLLAIDDNYGLLIAKGWVPESALRLFPADRKILLPKRTDLWPHPQFLDYHRRTCFKG